VFGVLVLLGRERRLSLGLPVGGAAPRPSAICSRGVESWAGRIPWSESSLD
jgi:hypothetical protein